MATSWEKLFSLLSGCKSATKLSVDVSIGTTVTFFDATASEVSFEPAKLALHRLDTGTEFTVRFVDVESIRLAEQGTADWTARVSFGNGGYVVLSTLAR